MKILKRIGIGLLIFIVLLIIISFFLPSKAHVERSVIMKTRPDIPFSLVNNLKSWHEWSPWHQIDTATVYTFSDTTSGVGAWYTWSSGHPKVGEGKLSITKSEPYTLIETEMDFGAMGISICTFTFADQNDGQVKVTWALDSDGKGVPWTFYVLSKYCNLIIDPMVGGDFETGLNNLKRVSEARPVKETILGFDLEKKELPETMVLSVRSKVPNPEIGRKLGEYFTLIGDLLQKSGVKESGRPMLIWHGFDATEADMEAAVPISSTLGGEGMVNFNVLPSTKALVVKYYGAYNRISPVFEGVKRYMEEHGIEPNGSVRQVYVVDPGMETDTARWLTEIVVPVL